MRMMMTAIAMTMTNTPTTITVGTYGIIGVLGTLGVDAVGGSAVPDGI